MSVTAIHTSLDRTLTLTRVFDAPRALVWKAWTDPRHLMNWWGPRWHVAETIDADVRTGGRWRHCLVSPETGEELWHHGTFREITPPERLVFSFVWEEEGERGQENVVTITFSEQGGKTLMHFTQAPFWSNGEREGHGSGWSSSFERLDEFLALANGSAA